MSATDKPSPKNARDLRLMYDTCGRVDGCLEYKRLKQWVMSSREYEEGDIISIGLYAMPDPRKNSVLVAVRREQVTNLREDGVYNPLMLTDWSKEYSFAEFVDSPFYQMCIDGWARSAWAGWDTSKMDEHEVYDDDTRWGIYAHVYERSGRKFSGWEKTGRIEAVRVTLDEDGQIALWFSQGDKMGCFFDGYVWQLAEIVEEHDEMVEQRKALEERGITIDGRTLSINFEEGR